MWMSGPEYVLGSPVKNQPLPVLTAMKDVGEEEKERPLSAWAAVFTCSNACVGAGVLAFPNVFANGGLITTLVSMTLVATFEVFSLRVLVRESQIFGVTNYQDVVQKFYGPGLSIFFSFSIAAYMFGALSAYTIIIGDVLSAVASRHIGKDSMYSSHSFNVCAVGLVFLLPLSLKRHFHDLQFVSFFSIMSLAYLMVAVSIRSFQAIEKKDWDILQDVHYFPQSFGNMMNAVPVMCFAFVCHLQICEVATELNPNSRLLRRSKSRADILVDGMYHSLQANESTSLLGGQIASTRVRKTMSKVVVLALSICGLFYGTIGLVAYLASPDKWIDTSDVLQGYGVNDTLMEVGRLALVLNIICSYPINLGPCRSAIMDVLQKIFKHKLNDKVLAAAVSVCLVVGSIATGLALKTLGVVFKIIGGTVGAVLIFMFPGRMLTSKAESKCSKDYLIGLILEIFGVTLLVCTTISYFTG